MLITFTQAPVTGGHQMGSFESRTWRGICGLEMVVAFMSCQKKKKKEKPDSRKEKFFISVHCNHCAKTLYITVFMQKLPSAVWEPDTERGQHSASTLCHPALDCRGVRACLSFHPQPPTISWTGSAFAA